MKNTIECTKLNDMNCILYLRVSSEEQVTNFSLTNQEEYCKREAERKGYEVLKIFREEGASAKNIVGRPELVKLLACCEKNKDKISALLVYRFDRLARETSDFLIIRKKLSVLGIKIISCTEPVDDSPTGRFVETLLASMAELDNSVKSERTKQGLKQRFLQGYTINAPPLGYKYQEVNGKSLAVPVEPEFSLLKRCFETFATGTVSLEQLAVLANDWGLRIYRKGKANRVRSQSLSRIFNSTFYYGLLKYPSYQEEILGKHQPMISEELFYRVRTISDGRNSLLGNAQKNANNPLYPLRGLVRCRCGTNLVSGRCKGRSQYYERYWCPNKHKGIQAKQLDEKLLELLSFVQPQKECVDLFMIMLHRNYELRIKSLTDIQKEAQTRENEIKNLVSDLVEDRKKMPEETYQNLLKKYEGQLLSTRVAKNDNLIEKYDLEGTISFMRALLNNLPRAYEVSNYTQKRILLGSILPSGLVFYNHEFLNPKISPIFRDIREPQNISVPLWVIDGT